MEPPKDVKSLVNELDVLLKHSKKTLKQVRALSKEDPKLKKLKADLKKTLKNGK